MPMSHAGRASHMHIVSPSVIGTERPARRGAIALAAIAKQFGEVSVLSDIDLEVRAGEFITILGPSGCGKSTLLRIIAGLEPQSAGSVAIDGLSMDGLAPDRRDIAMVFQSYALYPHLTVAENIAVPLRMRPPDARRMGLTVNSRAGRRPRRATTAGLIGRIATHKPEASRGFRDEQGAGRPV